MKDEAHVPSFYQRNRVAVFWSKLHAAIFLAALLIMPCAVYGQVSIWNGTSDHWHDAGAWTPFGVPNGTTGTVFDLNISDTIDWTDITGSRSARFLNIVAGNYTFDGTNATSLHTLNLAHSGNPLALSNPGTQLNFKDLRILATNGPVSLGNGTILTLDGSGKGAELFAQSLNSQGHTQLTNGALMNFSQSLNLGTANFNGTLDIQSGSNVFNENATLGDMTGTATGTVTIGGTDSFWHTNNQLTIYGGGINMQPGSRIQIGDSVVAGGHIMHVGHSSLVSAGNLIINGAGTINNSGAAVIAGNTGSFGKVVVNGNANPSWINDGSLTIGQRGHGILEIGGNGMVENESGFVGFFPGSTAEVTLDGSDAVWRNRSALFVGNIGGGTTSSAHLNIANGSVFVGNDTSASFDSELIVSDSLQLATLTMEGGGTATTGYTIIGNNIGTSGNVFVSGSGTELNTLFNSRIGNIGNGTLTVENGALVTDQNSFVGHGGSGTGNVTVNGAGTLWSSTENKSIGYFGNGSLAVSDTGNVTAQGMYVGNFASSQGFVTVDTNGTIELTDELKVGGTTGMGQVDLIDGQILVGDSTIANPFATQIVVNDSVQATITLSNGTINNAGSTILGVFTNGFGDAQISGSNSSWINAGDMIVGGFGESTLNVDNGGYLESRNGIVGQSSGSSGIVDVVNGGVWRNTESLLFGDGGTGIVRIGSDGTLYSKNAFVYNDDVSTGSRFVHLSGNNARWINSEHIEVGKDSLGTINVYDGASVDSNSLGIAADSGSSSANVTVRDAGSRLTVSNLTVGRASGGQGILDIRSDGLVQVIGSTEINATGRIDLWSGRFEFGTMSWEDFLAVRKFSGSMAGLLQNTAYTEANSLPAGVVPDVDITDVHIENLGTLYGDANIAMGLTNRSIGEANVTIGERMNFAGGLNNSGIVNAFGGQFGFGKSSINSGELNNFGGQFRFNDTLLNDADGFISGRGQFIANGGWTNEGVMAFSGGNADVLGDIELQGNGIIVTTGNSTTTFYDDVIHNGLEIRTSAGSSTVFLGSISGASNYTGAGTVFFEGDLRPGNSPAEISVEGNMIIGSAANSFFEIGGQLFGEFDRYFVGGDLLLDGTLSVDEYDGFEIGFNQQYMIIEVDGNRTGMFSNYGEGDLVGNFNGVDLHITYQAGDGNDVMLFTAVPEPSAGLFLLLVAALAGTRRSRPRTQMLAKN